MSKKSGSVAPKERINIKYVPATGGEQAEVELPHKMLVLGDFGLGDFGPSSPDIKLLSYMASVGAMSHAPFLAAPAPEFFNLSSFEELPNLKEIKDIFAGPRLGRPPS